MRKILGDLGSQKRHTFQAVFGKYGYKRYHDEVRGILYSPTMMVRKLTIVDDPAQPQLLSDHLWFNLTKGFAQLGLLKEGDKLQFNGRVAEYSKGFINKDKKDYELSYPTKIQLLTAQKRPSLPDDHQVLIGMIMNLNYKFYAAKKRPLVPYFMDAFAQWQKKQIQPLPIKCHQGNAYESSSNYDPVNYQTEKAALAKKIAAAKKTKEREEQTGIALLQKTPALRQDLLTLAKRIKAKNKGAENSEAVHISNRQISALLSKHHLPVKDQGPIKNALASSWFMRQLLDQQQLTPLEQLARKFNQH